MEGTDFEPFTDSQYQVLEQVIRAIQDKYPGLNAGAITGHEHIAPGRKTDPGPYFEWSRLGKMLGQKLPSRACDK